MPDAHEPVRNSLGDIVGSWKVTIQYDEASDKVLVHSQRPGSRWLRARSWSASYDPSDIEEALDYVLRVVRTQGARRLF